jgi:hypothetical protein
MKKERIIFILFIVPLFLSTSFLNMDHKKYNLASHEVEFKFIGYAALYGTPADCGIFSPDTVVLKGILSGEENVDKDDFVTYRGVLHISIKMAVCSVKRVNGEDHWCTMTVTGDGPVETELELDTAAHEGYGYIKIEYDSASLQKLHRYAKFDRHVYGTCDPQEMKEEEDDNVPNNSIATIFNGCELRSLKKVPKLRRGIYPIDSGPGGTITVEVKY